MFLLISHRFAYVEFESEGEATSVYKSAKGGLDVEGCKLYVDYAAERGSDGGGEVCLL